MTNNKNNIRYGTRMLAQGVEVSNDTRLTGLNNNDLIVGSSGCGKTGGYVVPGIQHIDGSLVVSDTKGQLERRFGKGLREKGYEVYTLDLVNPMRSCCYNPMAYIRKYRDGSFREQDILSLARLLCPLEDHSEPIWELSAANYIAFLISYCLETESLPGRNLPYILCLSFPSVFLLFSLPPGRRKPPLPLITSTATRTSCGRRLLSNINSVIC